MLTFLLALLVGLGSLGLYLSSFVYPETYRKGDLVWSGVGLFYALVLLVSGDRITGGVLLGQIASVSLIGWFGWQTFNARLGRTPSTDELKSKFSELLQPENRTRLVSQVKEQVSGAVNQVQTLIGSKTESTETSTAEPYQPLQREDFGNPTATVEPKPESTGKPDIGGTIAGIGQTLSNLLKKPEKNKETYVRKEFRDDETPAPVAADTAAPPKPAPIESPGESDSDSSGDEIVNEEVAYEAAHEIEEPVPPHPPTPDLVDAAVADAEEKDLPADPPEPTEDSAS